MDKPKSFVIWFRNASHNHTAVYNQGLGNAVSFDRATRYASREEAERVSAQLTDNEVVEFAVPPHRRNHGIGTQWVSHRGPRPTLTQTVNLEMLHDQLRKEAAAELVFSKSTTNPTKLEVHGMLAQRLQAQANALRETLRYLNVPGLPDPLSLPLHEVTK